MPVYILLLCFCVGCGTMISGSVERKLKIETAKAKAQAAEILPAEMKKPKAAGGIKFMFYALGAIAIAVGIGIAVVMKDMQSALIAALGGLGFCAVPFFLDLLYEILGPLKWATYVVLACLVIGFVGYVFLRLRNVFHDLSHPDDDDLHPETAIIVKAAKQRKAIAKIKK